MIDGEGFKWITPEGLVYIIVINTNFRETPLIVDKLQGENLIKKADALYLKKIASELKMESCFGPEHSHIIFLLSSPVLLGEILEEKRVEFRNYAAAQLTDSIVSAVSIPFQNVTIIPENRLSSPRFLPQPSLN